MHNQGIPIEMDIYGARYPESFLEKEIELKGITHHGVVMPLDSKYEIMENADAFVIPSSFDPTLNDDYQYSFPSKLTELLSTAKPVLYYGPSNTSIHEFLNRVGSSVAVTKRSVNLLNETLINLIDNYSARKLDAEKISRMIRKEYDMETTLRAFGAHLTHINS